MFQLLGGRDLRVAEIAPVLLSLRLYKRGGVPTSGI
jgi:hypothetical protein